jgi:hypothetical protein
MKLWISALVGIFAMLIVWMPRPVTAAEPMTFQPRVMDVHHWANDPYHHPHWDGGTDWNGGGPWYGGAHWNGGGPWYGGACRDPRFRRHHPFLCW